MLNKKRVQLIENGVPQDVDILTSAECVTFEDGETLQDKYDSGDIANVNTIGDISTLNGVDVVTSLNKINTQAKANTEVIESVKDRPSVAMVLRKEVVNKSWSSVSTLPYEFYQGSAVIYNNEIHILGTYANSFIK